MFGFGKKNKQNQTAVYVTVSETGAVRTDNQDAFFVDKAKTVFCVADGMGGGAEGATASRFVCEEIAGIVDSQKLADRVAAADAAIAAADARIRAYAKEKNFKQMGSTVVLLLLDPNGSGRAAVCHVGDSRVYRIRRSEAEPLTKDHTIGGELSALTRGLQAAGLRSRSNPLAHVLTRAIGAGEAAKADWRKIDVRPGDRLLLCSDGVHDVVSDRRIGFLLSRPEGLDGLSGRVAADVVAGGAPDNYTYVIVEIGGAR